MTELGGFFAYLQKNVKFVWHTEFISFFQQ